MWHQLNSVGFKVPGWQKVPYSLLFLNVSRKTCSQSNHWEINKDTGVFLSLCHLITIHCMECGYLLCDSVTGSFVCVCVHVRACVCVCTVCVCGAVTTPPGELLWRWPGASLLIINYITLLQLLPGIHIPCHLFSPIYNSNTWYTIIFTKALLLLYSKTELLTA